MAFQTGSATSQENLIGILATFAVAQGWTQDELDNTNNRASLHKGNIYVHFRWSGTEGGGANNIAMYQSLGFTPGNNPDGHPDDSGNGVNGTVLSSERRVSGIGDGPFTNYWFFQNTSPDYIYVVLEFSPGLFRHFGFGMIDKVGDWTGGEWVAGHVWLLNGVADDAPDANQHTLLMDGVHGNTTGTTELEPATIHIEGLPNQFASKWGNVGGGHDQGASWNGVDGGGNARSPVIGGFRGGFAVRRFGKSAANPLNGFVPLIPCPIVYIDKTPAGDDELYLLGWMPDVRHIQMKHFTPAQIVTIGSDDWYIFPGVRKQFLLNNTQESWNMGIAYKKVP